MISVPASALHLAQQTAGAAVAVQALAQVQAARASETAQNSSTQNSRAPKPSAANPPGVGGLVDQTA
jgi:hypothetical protein